jgi:hypothetical protein
VIVGIFCAYAYAPTGWSFSHFPRITVAEINSPFTPSKPYGQKIETVEKTVICPFRAWPRRIALVTICAVVKSRIGWRGGRMDWARILAFATGLVDQELLARHEYLGPVEEAAEALGR